MKTYTPPRYAYRHSADQDGRARHPVIVVGAGPVGLAAAIDLAQRGVPVVLLDEDDTVSVGSRAICYAKRSLEILDRLGVGQRIVDKGVSWNVGKVFFRDALAYRFELLEESGHRRPAFVNLQQYWLEQALVERASALPSIDLRWRNRAVALRRHDDHVEVDVDTPEGPYSISCDWLIVCDGARSAVRRLLRLEAEGQVFRDRFLIVDIRMQSDFPTERWFWFDPPFHRGRSVLLHAQADDVWRVDFQLGWDADPDVEKAPERILPRLRAMLGDDAQFDIEWASVYTFACRRLERFRFGRVLFAGDAAHVVSPFGARGANSGFQDADNLAWKLALVVDGKAPERLLDSYDEERTRAADENIRASTRSTDFITPKSEVSRVFRDAVLELAKEHAFARRLVNSGRLSVPSVLRESALNSADVDDDFAMSAGAMQPGAPAADAPVDGPRGAWLLSYLVDGFTLLVFETALSAETVKRLRAAPIGCRTWRVARNHVGAEDVIIDREGLVGKRYDARDGSVVLFRPDQHVCARWRRFDVGRVEAAIARATANDKEASWPGSTPNRISQRPTTSTSG
ncbi:MAG TPA: FAD-dependent oxidoreductase [Casimicrobiaceae bacterium]|nr:FAD-dependent oxidoreductase [Casimicrobiaceae bacterium]